MKKNKSSSNVISTNRRASYSYELIQKYEAGIVLTGSEIKSVRLGKIDIRQSYARPIGNEIFLVRQDFIPFPDGPQTVQVIPSAAAASCTFRQSVPSPI